LVRNIGLTTVAVLGSGGQGFGWVI